jgi:hypothetical protein
VEETYTSERICNSPSPPGTPTKQARDGEGKAYLPPGGGSSLLHRLCWSVYTEFIIVSPVSLLLTLPPWFGLAMMRVNYTLLIHKRL